MPEIEWEKSLLIKSNFLIEEYQKIVAELFPTITSLDEFADVFSCTFQEYQHANAKRLDPDSIRELKISCSSAAALLGVWWVNQFPQLVPIFLIEDVRRTPTSQAGAHVNVVIPLSSQISTGEALSAFHHNKRSDSNDVAIIDWTEYSKMKPSNPKKAYPVYPVEGVPAYVKDRLRHLGLSSKYSSKNITRMLTGAT